MQRIIIKIGTHTLVDAQGRPNKRRIAAICQDIATLHQAGKQVVLVSSGAIGVGVHALNMKRRPSHIAGLQMAAATGQVELLSLYHQYFAKHGMTIGQILLTHDDLKDRSRHLNARNTLLNLLKQKILPIINENDAVSIDEIKFGDNDILAALVAGLVDADTLIMLSTTDGLREFTSKTKSVRIPYIEKIDNSALSYAKDFGNSLSVGGMQAKLQAAKIANDLGAQVVIAPGNKKSVLQKIIATEDIGTTVGDREQLSKLNHKARWIHYFHRLKGAVIIDQGAAKALTQAHKSLLAVGIKTVEGQFPAGSLIEIKTLRGKVIAQGLCNFSSTELKQIKGKPAAEIATIFGIKKNNVAVHRDHLKLV